MPSVGAIGGYPSSNEIVAQYIETPLHVSTHLDGQMHAIPGGGDIASFPLSRCFGEGVIVEIRGQGDKAEATIRFRDAGTKHLSLAWAPLKKL